MQPRQEEVHSSPSYIRTQKRYRKRLSRPSKTCSSCLHVLPELPLNVRGWTCPKCDAAHTHNRDINAAINI
ncbi:MAG: transposase [Synergistaceae bacterium]|nr:transposase [Synergistaceae bacterium]